MTEIERLQALLALYEQINALNDRIIAQMKKNEEKSEEIIRLQGEIIEIYKQTEEKIRANPLMARFF